MKRKIIAACLITCMVLIAVTGATLAYFTDQDAGKNEFAVGGIDIDLWEIVGYDEDEEPITVGKGTDEAFSRTYENLFPTEYATKEVMITNNSTDSAYVRVTVVMNNHNAINNAIDEVYEKIEGYDIQAKYDEIFDSWGINYSHYQNEQYTPRMWMSEREDEECLAIDMAANYGYYVYDTCNWFKTEEDGNGDGFDVVKDTGYYEAALKGDDVAYIFYLKLDAGEDYKLFDGLRVPAEFTEAQAAMFDGLTIEVYADAIQTIGFDGNWEAAFNALNEIYPIGHWN